MSNFTCGINAGNGGLLCATEKKARWGDFYFGPGGPDHSHHSVSDPCAYARFFTNDGYIHEGGVVMKGFVQDIEGLAIKNDEFRRVLYTAKYCQLVVMALKPKEEIGMEVHKLDQFFRVEEGSGEAILDGVRTSIQAGFAVVVPAGTNHNIINTGSVPLKLYTLYAPPNHRDGVVHHTRAEAEADNEHFDGKTTE